MKPVKIAVTSSASSSNIATTAHETLLKNVGPEDCFIDFDTDISDDSYLLEVGEALVIEGIIQKLWHKTSSGTATIYVIKLFR